MLSRWMVRETSVAGTTFYQVYRTTDAVKVRDQIETYGGLWTTREEAAELAKTLNSEVKYG